MHVAASPCVLKWRITLRPVNVVIYLTVIVTDPTNNHTLVRQLESRLVDHPLFQQAKSKAQCEESELFLLARDDQALSYAAVVDLWQNDSPFQDYFTSLLADSPFDGFRWETPSLTNETTNRPFEFVLVNTPGFARRRSDRKTYSEYFTETETDYGVISFPNIRKDATLVVPSPRGNDDDYDHLAAFVRGAPKAQVSSLWCVLGRAVESCLSAKPLWVSTAGGGVAWLHVRIDSRPKYYSYAEHKTS